MPILLYRVDDRLVHGQVVVGWGQPLDLARIILVDDVVAESEWEQDLYRMGVPPEMEIVFLSARSAAAQLRTLQADAKPALLLTADIGTMRTLAERTGGIANVNLGGVHHRDDRLQKLRYVFLSESEELDLRALAAHGVTVTAQDVPGASPVPLDDVLKGSGAT